MKYYSDVTKQLYDTTNELREAEAAVAKAEEERKAALIKKQEADKKLKEQRAQRASEIEAAIKARNEAQRKVDDLISQFVKDYGAFHYSWTAESNNDLPFTFKCFLS